jgi:predicted transposase YbfD/YdcC
MAKETKINQTILVFKEIVDRHKIDIPKEGFPRKPIRKLIQFFRDISDVRVQGKIEYPLYEILMVAFLAVMADSYTFIDIANFGKSKEAWLKKYFYIKHGIPSHDTFRRVFSIINPLHLQKATVSFLLDNIKLIKRTFMIESEGMKQYCVDGKTDRGTGKLKGLDGEVQQLHTLHVYDRTDGICIISKEVTTSKTNEIPVAQNVLRAMDLRDSVVSFDALHAQRDTVDVVIDQKGDYIVALKGNQPELHEEVKTFFTPARLKRIGSGTSNYYESKEKSHNRIETRKYYLSTNVSWLVQGKDWRGLKSLIYYHIHTEDINSGKITDEIHYYISSLTDIILCADSIRGHWSVENSLHWQLDVNFLQDNMEILDRVAAQNMSLLNKMALSLHKLIAPLLKCSVRSSKKIVAWEADTLLSAFRILDEDILAKAMLNVKA